MIFETPTDPRAERLLRYLDGEIETIQKELQRPGWTKWALVGTLATTLWLVLDQLEKSSISGSKVGLLLVTASLLSDAISYSHLLSGWPNESRGYQGLRYTDYVFTPMRPALLLLCLRYGGLIVVLLNIPSIIGTVPSILALLLSTPFLLVSMVGVLLTYVRFPISIKPESHGWKNTLFHVVIVAGSLYAAANFILLLMQPGSQATFADLRVAALVIVIWYLLINLAGLSVGSPLLSVLVTTRRDFLFGSISLETAISRTEIAASGLKVADIFQQDVATILSLSQQQNQQVTNIAYALDSLSSLWKEHGEILDDQQRQIASKHVNAIVASSRKLRQLQNSVERAVNTFIVRSELLRRISGSDDSGLSDLLAQIRKSILETTAQVTKATEQAKSAPPGILEQLHTPHALEVETKQSAKLLLGRWVLPSLSFPKK